MKIDIFKGIDMSEEGKLKRQLDSFDLTKRNPENMSIWLPRILSSTTSKLSRLKIPDTKIIALTFDYWKWLRSDSYTKETIKEFNDWLVAQLDDFLMGEPLFMKSGVFSNKFQFGNTMIDNNEDIGEKFLNVFYQSMVVGADNTSEVVFRQRVIENERTAKIYGGMPLHTEFRVFYDFDSKEIVGVSNYWHPDEMNGYLSPADQQTYNQELPRILSDFNENKHMVAFEVSKYMEGCTKLKGKWSVDVMKNGEDYWLIDMARMERSALVHRMEPVN
jgi:hypothetical protein